MRLLTLAGWKRQHGDKDMLSNWRNPPRPSEKSPEQGRPYNRRNREEDERVAAVVAMKRSNVRGAKGPCHLHRLQHREGKDEMIKASIDLQDLRRRIYVKAKAEPSWRFYTSTSARWRPYAQRMRWPSRTMAPREETGSPSRPSRRGGSARAATGRADWAHLPA